MNWKLLMSGLLLSGGLLISGCSMLPSPGSLIMAPRQPSAQTQNAVAKPINDGQDLIDLDLPEDFSWPIPDNEANSAVQKFLPSGAKLEEPKNPGGAKAIQQQDMDGDGKAELLVTYRVGQNPGELGAILLQKKQNNWEKVWEQKGSLGYALDRASFADITGDGRPELLLGWTMGASAGNGLDIFTWQDKEKSSGGGVALDDDGNALNEVHWQGTMTHIASIGYHKIDIINANNQKDTGFIIIGEESPLFGKQAALALWRHDTGEAYSIKVLRWTKVGSDTGLVPAEDLYPEYYKKVVAYYQEKVKEMPEAAFYWYYLADA